jgi:hypothetical protein
MGLTNRTVVARWPAMTGEGLARGTRPASGTKPAMRGTGPARHEAGHDGEKGQPWDEAGHDRDIAHQSNSVARRCFMQSAIYKASA